MSDLPKPVATQRKPRRVDEAVAQQARIISQIGEVAARAGCPIDQTTNFLKAGIFLFPKQIEASAAARACDLTDGPTRIGFGGPRGPGKSFWQFAQMLADDMQRFPGLKFLIIRKTQKAIREQLRDVLGKVCGVGDAKRIPYEYKEQKGVIELPNGSYAVVGHFKDEKDLDHYLGQEYDGLLIEEANTLTHTKIENIFTCLRTSKTGWRPRAYLTWNWGGIGHGWLMKQFYEPWEKREQKDTRYVLATVHDNPAINPEYIETLKKLTGWKYKSWYLGDPHFQAGQFFTNWDESWHVFPNKNCTLLPLNPPGWFGSLDYGFSHPTSFHLHCNDRLGNTYTVGRVHKSQAVIEEIAQDIFGLLRSFQLTVSDLDFISAGRDCFSKKHDGRTIAEDYSDCGLELVPCEVDRVNGWAVMQQRLGDPARNIKPTWFIHKTCTELIEQIPLAQNHETRAGDIEKMNCLVGDTLITTINGPVQIKMIMAGDIVQTMAGFSKVLKTKKTGHKHVRRLKFTNGIEIEGTPEHKIWCNGGFKSLDEIANCGDHVRICVNYQNKPLLKPITESGFIAGRNINKGTSGYISTHQHQIAERELDCSIRKFGNRLMVKFHKTVTYITRTETRSTILSKIFNVLRANFIARFTKKPLGMGRQNGMARLKEEGGMENMRNQFGQSATLLKRNASVAEKNFLDSKPENKGTLFVPATAASNSDGEILFGNPVENVKIADVISCTADKTGPDFVVCDVQTYISGGMKDVFDIQVENNHEFFANGILVHNSDENGEGGDDALESCRNGLLMEGTSKAITHALPMAVGKPLAMISMS